MELPLRMPSWEQVCFVLPAILGIMGKSCKFVVRGSIHLFEGMVQADSTS